MYSMFVGHALAAFALVAVVARRRGQPPSRALAFGCVAGLFAAAPDVDIGYALVGVVSTLGTGAGALGLAESFWATGNVVHRAVTHSLVVAPAVALAAAAWVDGRTGARAAALALATGLVAVTAVVGGGLAALVTVAFVVTALALGEGIRRRTDIAARTTFWLALAGLVSHPFGDVFTGEPPALLYPFATEVLTARVALSADPVFHLLGAFAIELATVWAAVIVWTRLRAERDGRVVGPFDLPVGSTRGRSPARGTRRARSSSRRRRWICRTRSCSRCSPWGSSARCRSACADGDARRSPRSSRTPGSSGRCSPG
ncbi:metal-dependent hydrolase [Halobaculum litoreum]|uniref:Metal-dependent hydrolase n=1 Tax=Halobaculum litoreum TaxID=3031998 RepID=A0ABD5XNZ6_9EURY